MLRSTFSILTTAALGILTAACVDGRADSGPERVVQAPVLNPANGHYYQVVLTAQAWDGARAEAAAQTYQGRRGHLATIGSPAENEFIRNLGVGKLATWLWIGAYQAPGAQEPAGGWRWVTGESFAFTDWAANEPDNFDGGNAINLLIGPRYLGWVEDNGTHVGAGVDGYIVEYERAEGTR